MRLLKLSALAALVLFSAAGFLVLLAVRTLPVSGIGGGGQAAFGNGDVNCDGTLDITDAVLVLEHLFRGGEAPCAIAQGGPGFPDVVRQLEILNGSVSLLADQVRFKWPPRPQDVVNIRPGRLTGSGDLVFAVPLESFLIVTDLSFVCPPGSTGRLVLHERREAYRSLKMELAGAPEANAGVVEPIQWHSSIGLVFSPGSDVVATSTVPFELVGYLAPTTF